MIFWFTGSIAWAAGLSGLKSATNADSVFKVYKPCSTDFSSITRCVSFAGATYGGVTVAVVSDCHSVPTVLCIYKLDLFQTFTAFKNKLPISLCEDI